MTSPNGDLQPGVRVTKIRASEPARRPPHPWIHPCPTCGLRFWTKPWKGRPATYCSDACRQTAYRVRRRQDDAPHSPGDARPVDLNNLMTQGGETSS